MILKSESKNAHYTILQYNNFIFLGSDHNKLDPGQGKKCSCQLRNFIAIKKQRTFPPSASEKRSRLSASFFRKRNSAFHLIFGTILNIYKTQMKSFQI